jgi:AcrR family transcriptional regulator
MSNNQTPPPPSERESVGSKTRSRKKTVGEIQQAIARLQASQSKVSISAVAKAAGITPALIHNTYPDMAEKIRGLAGKATLNQRDTKQEALIREREINRALREELAGLRTDVAKIASINQVLLHEIAVLKGVASGKVVSILHPKQPVG